ncbi:TonB-dependent receptor [Bacteroides sp. ET489]|uniref:TonB-dependent receptor n=1 Tax=Bacteroides sp. ET489 TaxID=3057126 RepID=UPI002671DE7C|nr:TonB-dependent receptor [Bacteroides sp. ET489]MDO3391994.1 TonB-dependent receptor [Bacteroides sp. ET489]
MKKFLIWMVVTCIGCGNLWAADRTVKGYVLDKEGTPLPGAYVYDEDKHTAVTNEDGYFELSVSEEIKQLRAAYVGFNALIYTMERPDDIQILVMSPSTELEEVVVTAGGTGTIKNRSNVLNTESVTSQALTRAACCNLSESFETNPSVDVAYSDAVTGAKQIQLLGLAGTYVQMLTENFPNLRGVASTYGLDYIPGPWMQSIQVSKGAASVKNGYESVTGQIDVEYKKPKVADPLLVNLFANSTGRYEGNAVGAVELNDRLSTALFLNYYNEERTHDKNKDTFLDMPEMQSFSVMNRWHYQTPRFVSQSGIKVLADRRTSGQTSHTLHDDENFIPYTINNDANRVELFSKNGFILNQDRNESVAVIVSGSYHDQQSNYADKIYNVYESNIYASLLYESEFGDRHKLAAGLNYNWDNYSQRGNVIERYRPQERNVSESVAGAYAEYTWTPVENFTWMLGLRTDYSILHHWFVTPRMHLKYAPVHWLDLRASAGKGYRTTFIFPENSYLLASNRTWHIADDLKQEEAWNYGISASFHIPIKSEELTVNAEWFYTDFQNQVVIDMDKDTHGIYFYNLNGKSTSSVFQIDVTYPLFRGFTLLGAYRWMDVKCTYGDRTLRKPLTSRYKALVTASYETSLKKWQFDVTVQFNGGGRMPAPDAEHPLWNYTFPSYTLLSAQVTRRFRRWNIYVGGENLTNYKQKNPIVSAGDPYSPDFDATMVWGPTMGYKLYAGIRYNIPKM